MSVIVPYANDGKLRVLGIAGRRGEPLLPGVPTMSDAGLPDFRVGSWDALFAPKGTPAPILDRMHDVVQEVLADSKVKRVWEEQGAKVEFESRADFTRFVEREIARWSRIATRFTFGSSSAPISLRRAAQQVGRLLADHDRSAHWCCPKAWSGRSRRRRCAGLRGRAPSACRRPRCSGRTHAAGADRVVGRLRVVADPGQDLVVALTDGPGENSASR